MTNAPVPSASSVGPTGDFRRLLEWSHTFHSAPTPTALYRAIHRECSRELDVDGFHLSLLDPPSDLARVVHAVEEGEERSGEARYRASHSEVLRTGRAVLVGDVRHSLSLSVLKRGGYDEEPRSVASVPLRHDGRILGAVSVQSRRPNAYTRADLELLQAIADIAVVAVERARQVETVQERAKEAERIAEIGRDLTSSLELEVVLRKIVEATANSLAVDSVTVWVLQDGIARAGASTTTGGSAPTGERVWEIPDSTRERLSRSGAPLPLSRLTADELPPNLLSAGAAGGDASPGSRASSGEPTPWGLLVPLSSQGILLGVLAAAAADRRSFDSDQARIMSRLGAQAAVAIENARLHADVEALSLTDPLTGLPNRRHLMIHLEREVAAAMRGRPLAAVIFDVDHFKPYNDTFGHLAGDEILKLVAEILRAESRAMNFSGRYGGDEFISVISDTEPVGVRAHALRICRRVEDHPKLAEHGITLSYGLAHFAPSMETANDLIQAADTDLYRAKNSRTG